MLLTVLPEQFVLPPGVGMPPSVSAFAIANWEQLALAGKVPDILLLKIALHLVFLAKGPPTS